MADAERYTIYSPKTKRLSVTIVNNIFHMSGYPDLRESNYNRNILPFKDFLGFEVLKESKGKEEKDYHMNVSYSGLERIIDRVKSKLEGHEECCLAVSISSHGKIEENDGKINHFLLCGTPEPDDREDKIRWYCTNNLVMQFSKCLKDPNTNRCKGPLMVFIQACRGGKDDFGTSYCVTDHQEQEQQDPGLDSGIQSMTMTSNNGELESGLLNTQGPRPEYSLSDTGDQPGTESSLSDTGDQPGTESSLSDTGAQPGTESSLSDTGAQPGTESSLSDTGDQPGTESSLSDAGDRSGTESSLPDSGNHSASSTSTTTDEDQLVHEFAPMCPLHCVVAFASAHKYTSKNNNKMGGWLLYSFNSTVKKSRENEERSILSLLTEANNPVTGMAGEKGEKGVKCIGTFQHKLVKDLILKRVIETGDGDEEVEYSSRYAKKGSIFSKSEISYNIV